MIGILLIVTVVLVFFGVCFLKEPSVRIIGALLIIGAIFAGGEVFSSCLPAFCDMIFGKKYGWVFMGLVIAPILAYYGFKCILWVIKTQEKK